MSSNNEEPEFPEDYRLTECEYQCNDCKTSFRCRISREGVLVKFVADNNRLERWMPTYERGGYLDLLEKLVPGFRRDNEISMKVFRQFESEFMKYQHRPKSGDYWTVGGCECPNCGGHRFTILSESGLRSPPVNWMTYDPIL